MIRVGIVDDHESIRDSYRRFLEDDGKFQVIGSLPSASMAVKFCEEEKPDVLLMDICTEGEESGLGATKHIKLAFPEIKIVVMTGFDEISYIPRAREAGADAFVYKSKSLKYMISVIDDVLLGKKIFPEPMKIKIPEGETPLTERELVVLRLLCKNYSREEIADELCISEYTVKRHLSNMLNKTGFHSVMSMVVYMVSNGWINPNV